MSQVRDRLSSHIILLNSQKKRSIHQGETGQHRLQRQMGDFITEPGPSAIGRAGCAGHRHHRQRRFARPYEEHRAIRSLHHETERHTIWQRLVRGEDERGLLGALASVAGGITPAGGIGKPPNPVNRGAHRDKLSEAFEEQPRRAVQMPAVKPSDGLDTRQYLCWRIHIDSNQTPRGGGQTGQRRKTPPEVGFISMNFFCGAARVCICRACAGNVSGWRRN